MSTLTENVTDFLAQKRIAVAGVSRGKDAANHVYLKLRNAGYEVFPINPNASEVEGDTCYPSLEAIADGVDGVVIATHPNITNTVVQDCAKLGITRVWMHRSFGQGSVSEEAVKYCQENGITVIAGGCPMMFCEPVDVVHKCMRWVLNATGGLPK